MRDCCFFTVYDARAREMAQGVINSVKHWYPDIPMEAVEIDIRNTAGGFDLQGFCSDVLIHGSRLLDEYKRIIYIDPDSVMCNLCPDLFGDFDLGVVQNNNPTGPEYGGTEGVYINAGLVVCTNKEAWEEIIKEYQARNNKCWECLNHQNAVNYVYHNTKHKVSLLEFSDRVYGITGLAHYQDMELRDKDGVAILDGPVENAELYLPSNKKLCVFHSAGVYWKTGTKINFDYIKNENAREMIRSYTC